MLRERIISAVVGIPVIVIALLLGKFVFALLIAAIVLISMDELFSIFLLRGLKPNVIIGILGGAAVIVGALFGGTAGMALALIATAILTLTWQTFTHGRITDTGLTILALVYIAFTLSHMILFFDLTFGFIGVLLVFIGTWVSDISAYTIGRSMGKRKIVPLISANKTLEGGIAGLVAPAVMLGLVFVLPWLPFVSTDGIIISILKGLVMGAAIGIAAPIGDLIESRMKREMRVKDSGGLIPGHGGFLDRFDSVIVTSVVGYYYWLMIT